MIVGYLMSETYFKRLSFHLKVSVVGKKGESIGVDASDSCEQGSFFRCYKAEFLVNLT